MENKKQRLIDSVLVFFFFTVIIMLLNLTNPSIVYDNIWVYHMSQKVADGYWLYSEISTVVMPIFFWLGALFIKIFGSCLSSLYIYTGVVWGGIATLLYNIVFECVEKKNNVFFAITILYILAIASVLMLPGYNLVAAMWYILAVFLEIKCEKKVSEAKEYKANLYYYFIGFVIGLSFFTKQNIGAFAVIATGIITLVNNICFKKKNPLKETLLKASGFLSVCTIMLIYFMATNTFMHFWNYCIGGLLEFAQKNEEFGIPIKLFFAVVMISVSVFLNFDKIYSKRLTNRKLFVIAVYCTTLGALIYPLTNLYHVILGMILLPILGLILIDSLNCNDEYWNNLMNVMIVLISLFTLLFSLENSSNGLDDYTSETPIVLAIGAIAILILILFCVGIYFVSNREKFIKPAIYCSLVLFCIIGMCIYINYRKTDLNDDLKIYNNLFIDQQIIDNIQEVISFIKENEKDGKIVLPVSAAASYYTASLGRNNYKFDLMLYGSLGKAGVGGVIEDLENLDDNILLLKDTEIFFQEPKEIDEYVRKNYIGIDRINNWVLYEKIK